MTSIHRLGLPLKSLALVLGLAVTLGLAASAHASSSFPAELDQLCSSQYRIPPNPAELALIANPPSGDCALCHMFDASLGEAPSGANVTPAGEAFLAGQLDVFCAPGNLPPVIDPIADVVADIGQLILFNVHATDPEGRRVTLTASGLPTGARFVTDGNNNGSFWWTPVSGQGGSYIVTFIATDPGTPVRTTSVEVTLTIDGGNRPPVLQPIGPFAIFAGSPLEILLSASDPDGDVLEFSLDPVPPGASLQPTGPTTAFLTWTPDESQVGNHELTFAVSDALLLDAETIVVTVGAVNAPPVLAPIGDRVVDVGATLEIAISASDGDQDMLSFSAQGLPNGAVLADLGDGTAVIEWMAEAAGVHFVTLTVTDDGMPPESASETFAIEAEEPPPTAPSLVVLSASWTHPASLVVSGEGAAPDAPVDVFDALSGALVGSTVADAGGAFELAGDPAVVPCAVLASSEKTVSEPLDVEGAGKGCSVEPRMRVHDARWLCVPRLFYLIGDHAPAGSRVRAYDARLGTLIAEANADAQGRFYLRKRMDRSPGLVELGVEWGGVEAMLDGIEVKQPGRCPSVPRRSCDDDDDHDSRGHRDGHRHDRDGDRDHKHAKHR